jgi:hypothetical protein
MSRSRPVYAMIGLIFMVPLIGTPSVAAAYDGNSSGVTAESSRKDPLPPFDLVLATGGTIIVQN